MSISHFTIQPQRLRQLLHRMVDIYSPSGKEEEVLDFLHTYLKRQGLPVIRQPVDDYRHNLLVMPSESEVRLALIGHVDTVTAHELDDYGYEEQGDLVRGLGTADMKGGCAAMIEAFLTLRNQGYTNLPAGLALVVGEEEEGDGAQKLVREMYFPWAIIGEPTDLRPCLSHYGYVEAQILTRGKRMHASLANQGQNAIETMLHLLLRLSHYMKTERPELIYNIRDLSSAQAGFAVPDRCESWLDIHLPPSAPIGEITTELEEVLAQACQEDVCPDASLRFVSIHAGYQLPEKGKMVDALKSVFAKASVPWEPQAFPSHSDANLIWAAGIKPILLGPGQLEKAHASDESVSFQQVCLAAQLYFDVLVSLLS